MPPLPRPLPLAVASALALLAQPAGAEPRAYRVAARDGGTRIEIVLPYSFGTHRSSVASVQGEVRIDPETLAVAGGRLAVPIDAIRSDDATRDCHMREALGLDYRRSRFPKEHACEDDRLPASGPDAVAFPEIAVEVQRARLLGDAALLAGGKEIRAEADVAFVIHGVARPARLELTVSRDPAAPGALRLRGSHAFTLRDYGVVVKSAHVLFVTISVDERATAAFDLRLVPATGAAGAGPGPTD
jgi:polyisoprenoid-binding protein YceI